MLLFALLGCSGTSGPGLPQISASPSPPLDEAPPSTAVTAAAEAVPTAAPPLRVEVSEAPVVRGPRDRPRLSLVVNVGAGYPPAVEMLDVLAASGVRATFFVMGWLVERNPELLLRIQAAGHEIASHGHSILDLTSASDAEVTADLEAADRAISAVTGQSSRPLWSPSAGYQDARVRRIAAGLGYRPILWSQDSGDWRLDATADEVLRAALAGAEPGGIIVIHLDSSRSRSATLPVLAELIDQLRRQGLEPVTITDLLTE
jgi:peptidoglycan/xylan/chitin deacetylase (PgdA/CDA1 family)